MSSQFWNRNYWVYFILFLPSVRNFGKSGGLLTITLVDHYFHHYLCHWYSLKCSAWKTFATRLVSITKVNNILQILHFVNMLNRWNGDMLHSYILIFLIYRWILNKILKTFPSWTCYFLFFFIKKLVVQYMRTQYLNNKQYVIFLFF